MWNSYFHFKFFLTIVPAFTNFLLPISTLFTTIDPEPINELSPILEFPFIGSGSIVVNNVEIGNKKFVKAGTIVKKNLKWK